MRLNGNKINPLDIESISMEDDAYYKTNEEYNEEVNEFEDVMDGV